MFKTFRLTNLLALATATFVLFATATANAQKPALVKDIDALGRAPYQQTVLFNQTGSYCTNFVCTVNFNAVPAGYRLVVTHVSARYKLGNGNVGGTVATVGIGIDGYLGGDTLQLPAPTYLGFSSYIVSSPVTFYVEPGRTPTVFLGGKFVSTDGSYSAQVTVVGHLISIN
jgi:hypothetical protein